MISSHIKNIFKENELERNSVVAFIATTSADGKVHHVENFNLDMIISVGYRVNSKSGTQFRLWATRTLNDHLVKGYTINEKRLLEQQGKLTELKNAVDLIKHSVTINKSAVRRQKAYLILFLNIHVHLYYSINLIIIHLRQGYKMKH